MNEEAMSAFCVLLVMSTNGCLFTKKVKPIAIRITRNKNQSTYQSLGKPRNSQKSNYKCGSKSLSRCPYCCACQHWLARFPPKLLLILYQLLDSPSTITFKGASSLSGCLLCCMVCRCVAGLWQESQLKPHHTICMSIHRDWDIKRSVVSLKSNEQTLGAFRFSYLFRTHNLTYQL